jgi:hypothetical protein
VRKDLGAPPKSGWAQFVPELLVEDLGASLSFWRELLGFGIAYERPKDRFVYLERADGIQLMLCQRSGNWETGSLERPFGRGAMFQMYVESVDPILAKIQSSGQQLYVDLREVWRQCGNCEGGQREFFLQDPGGYLVMVAELIGERPLPQQVGGGR